LPTAVARGVDQLDIGEPFRALVPLSLSLANLFAEIAPGIGTRIVRIIDRGCVKLCAPWPSYDVQMPARLCLALVLLFAGVVLG
jgi:hypothetical protein